MKFRVNIDRTEAIRRGVERWGWQEVEVPLADLTETQRDNLAAWLTHTNATGSAVALTDSDFPSVLEATPAEVGRALDQIPTILAARKRKAEEEKLAAQRKDQDRIEKWLDGDTRYFGRYIGPQFNGCVATENTAEYVERTYAFLPETVKQAVLDRTRALFIEDAEAVAQRIREQEQKDQEAAAQAKALAEYEATLVERLGTENQKERFAAGFLNFKKEIMPLRRDEIFKDLDVAFPRYVPITHGDCCKADDDTDPRQFCDCGLYGPRCKAEVAIYESGFSVPADAWERLKRITQIIRDTYPNATVAFREHDATVPCCKGKCERLSILVSVQDGPRTCTREYAAD